MRRGALLPAVVLAALCAAAAVPAAHARPTHDVTVMTRNLFLGVDIRRAAGPRTREELQALAVQLVREVKATDPAGRMNLVAAEIARVKPDLVGLQEVAFWQLGSTHIDYAALLLSSLLRRGLAYRLVGGQTEADVSLPTSAGQGRFRLGDAILVRRGVGATHIRHASFHSQITFPIATGTVPVH
nr:hypothetical protein [Actinomycetota bacterium]